MAKSTRIKKLQGKFGSAQLSKILEQIDGKGILCVVSINPNCNECKRIQMFVNKLENGLIHKMPDLIMLYGYSRGVQVKKAETEEGEEVAETSEPTLAVNAKSMEWADHSDGHGYSIYLSEDNVSVQTGEFDHSEFSDTLLDYLRRFRSSVLTLADLEARRKFLEKKRTGIIVETRSSTKNSDILKLEEYVKARRTTVKIPIYFLKGVAEEVSYVFKGEYKIKQKGLSLEKLFKNIAKLSM